MTREVCGTFEEALWQASLGLANNETVSLHREIPGWGLEHHLVDACWCKPLVITQLERLEPEGLLKDYNRWWVHRRKIQREN